MDSLVKHSLLYDFYGDLLTDHQRRIYEGYVIDNLSLAEIAEEAGISRQGVHDTVKRCTQLLEDYEKKLHLAGKFAKISELVRNIECSTDLAEARKTAGKIIDIL